MDREHGLRRASGLTGLLAALGVAGSLAVATVAYAARPPGDANNDSSNDSSNEPTTATDSGPSSDSSWPQLSDDSSATTDRHATSGGS